MTTTSSERCFIDTNVLLYWVANDADKASAAWRIISAGAVVSVQVLNEFVAVARRKYHLDWEEVRDTIEAVAEFCEVGPITLQTQNLAMDIAASHGLHIYDACIVAAAELSGCDVLYTEDLNSGQRIGGITIRNPFA